MKYLKFLLTGTIFGIILAKTEVISWYRIQEMFHFQAFHMYGVIMSAIIVGIISISLIKFFKIRSLDGSAIILKPKTFHKGNIWGGIIFGIGWAMTGACPGPIFTLIGYGNLVFIIVLISAMLGTFTYGVVKEKLPH